MSRVISPAGGDEGSQPEALPVYLIALEEARGAFADLMAQHERIRRNVGGLLGFAAIAVSIFGFSATRPTSTFGWVVQVGAVVGVVGLAASAAYVTLPLKLTPSMDPARVIGWGDDGDAEADTVRNLALGYEKSYQENRPQVARMFKGQISATVFFGLAVIMLALRATGV
jgi:hypothetical protein